MKLIIQSYNKLTIMIIDEDILKNLMIYIKIQNIELLRIIAIEEGWDFKYLVNDYIEK